MTNDEYTARVAAGDYPVTSYVPHEPAFSDTRGTITNLLLTPLNSVAILTSKRGTVRANHYHRTDWHYAYVISGRVAYFERDVGAQKIPTPTVFVPGQMFFTPPMREHAMVFAADTVIMTFARNVRSHDNHEADVVRVEFINPDLVKALLG